MRREILKWVRKYEMLGERTFEETNRKYFKELKETVIKEYLEGKDSFEFANITILFYNKKNAPVELDGVEVVAQNDVYSIASAGVVTITAIENGYVGKITATFAEEGEDTGNVVSQNTTYSFNSVDATVEDHYYVLNNQCNVQGNSTTFDKLTLDATEGKISDNGGTWFQYNTGSKIIFTVAAGATVTIEMYQGSLQYTVNQEAANDSHTYTFTEETVVTITSTGNGYIGKIIITF